MARSPKQQRCTHPLLPRLGRRAKIIVHRRQAKSRHRSTFALVHACVCVCLYVFACACVCVKELELDPPYDSWALKNKIALPAVMESDSFLEERLLSFEETTPELPSDRSKIKFWVQSGNPTNH